LAVHTENHADGPTTWWTLLLPPNPTTSRDAPRQVRTTQTGGVGVALVCCTVCRWRGTNRVQRGAARGVPGKGLQLREVVEHRLRQHRAGSRVAAGTGWPARG